MINPVDKTKIPKLPPLFTRKQDALGRKRNLVINISELGKGNGELYMVHGNLNITVVYLRFS